MTSYFSFIFLAAFLPVVVVLYAVAPRRTRWVVLLMASYVFFFWLSRTLILALWVSTLSIYLTGLGLGALIRQRDAAVKAVKSGKREIRARYARKMKLVLAAGPRCELRASGRFQVLGLLRLHHRRRLRGGGHPAESGAARLGRPYRHLVLHPDGRLLPDRCVPRHGGPRSQSGPCGAVPRLLPSDYGGAHLPLRPDG